MRNQPIEATPWEVEAALRREVIASDFGGPPESLGDPRPRSIRRIGPVRRFTALIDALAQTSSGTSVSRVERATGCQPAVGAVEPGS